MDRQIDTAIENVLKKIRPNIPHDEAMKLSQAVLNLAHAKEILVEKPSKTKGAGS